MSGGSIRIATVTASESELSNDRGSSLSVVSSSSQPCHLHWLSSLRLEANQRTTRFSDWSPAFFIRPTTDKVTGREDFKDLTRSQPDQSVEIRSRSSPNWVSTKKARQCDLTQARLAGEYWMKRFKASK
ncbi:Hypothetical predicted protein [Cloeon dipterum]|uniref:Uncharacterized protein n=1 Tax=Cloeon dipterum TaxID=197152 RepID=A0A8S1C868_9INSE|nr:Hypothetical predicted protein [Cloeon dipterum]